MFYKSSLSVQSLWPYLLTWVVCFLILLFLDYSIGQEFRYQHPKTFKTPVWNWKLVVLIVNLSILWSSSDNWLQSYPLSFRRITAMSFNMFIFQSQWLSFCVKYYDWRPLMQQALNSLAGCYMPTGLLESVLFWTR